jgi:hypothetical protein
MLARLLATRLQTALASVDAPSLTAIVVEIEENFGQSALYRMSLP